MHKNAEVQINGYKNDFFEFSKYYRYISKESFVIKGVLKLLVEKHKIEPEIAKKKKEIELNKNWVIPLTANIRETNSTNSPVIDKLERGNYVFIQENSNNWYRVFYSGPKYVSQVNSISELHDAYKKGWIYKNLLSSSKINKLYYSDKRRWRFVEDNPNIPTKFKKAIKEGKLMLGMSKAMAVAIWGRPNDINRTVGSWGVHEQWIYGGTYIYFKNDVLTSWQD